MAVQNIPSQPPPLVQSPPPASFQKQTSHTEIKYGIIIGVSVSIYILIEFFLGFHTTKLEIGAITGYLALIIPLIAFFFAIKEKRNNLPNQTLTLSKGLKTSFLISILAGAIMALFMFIYISWINPEFGMSAVKTQVDELLASGISEAEVTKIVTTMLVVLSPGFQAASAFIGSIIQGMVIGGIYTLILKRKKISNPKTELPTV